MSFIDAITAPGIVPPWLLGTVGKAKLQMLGATLDMLGGPTGKSVQVAEIGMPTKCDPSVLPFIGKDRLMPQGAGETTANYRVRLQQAMPEWQQYSGNAWGVLRECRNQLLPSAPLIRTISNTGVWDWMVDSASISNPPYHEEAAISFLWDGIGYTDPTPSGILAWWRFWTVIFSVSPTTWCSPLGTWGSTGKKWGDPTIAWGVANPPAIFRALSAAITRKKSASSWCRWMIISFDATLFDPAQPNDGTHNPNQTFGRWSQIVNGQYVPARFANARYADVPA